MAARQKRQSITKHLKSDSKPCQNGKASARAFRRRPITTHLLAGYFTDFFKETVGDIDHLGIDHAILRDRFLQSDGDDLVGAQRGHAAKLASMYHIDCSQPITGREHSVERAWRSAALNVT